MRNLRIVVVLAALLACLFAGLCPAVAQQNDTPLLRVAAICKPYVTALPAKEIKASWGKPRPWLKARSAAGMKRAVAAVNALGVDAVVVLGDLTWTGSDADFQEIDRYLEQVKAPVYVTPGGRDLSGGAEGFAKHFERHHGNVRYSVDLHGVHLQFATFLAAARDEKAKVELADWMAKDLAAAESPKAVLVFGGVPEVRPGESASSRRYWDLLAKHNVAVQVQPGHSHDLSYAEIAPTYVLDSAGWSNTWAATLIAVYPKRVELSLILAPDQPRQTLTVPNPVGGRRLAPAAEDPHRCPSYTRDLAAKPKLTFIQFADSQFDDKTTPQSRARFQYDKAMNGVAVAEANRFRPPLAFMTGDLINKGTKAEWDTFHEVYDGLKVPLYCLPGNHDVNGTGTQWAAEAAQEFGGPLSVYQHCTRRYASEGKRRFTIEKGGCTFICLDTADANIDAEQLAWLKKELERTRQAKHVFVLGHHPAYEPWGGTIRKGREELLKLMKEYKVAAYLCGHRHRYRYRLHEGTAHVLCDCLCWGSRRSYVIYHVFDDRIVACWKPVAPAEGTKQLYERVVFPEPRFAK